MNTGAMYIQKREKKRRTKCFGVQPDFKTSNLFFFLFLFIPKNYSKMKWSTPTEFIIA